MIRYQLACNAGHGFESWFRDSRAFDEQAEEGLITCPICQTDRVAKSIMAPAVVSRGAPVRRTAAPSSVAPPDPAEIRGRLKALRAAILKDAQDVGTAFPDEARRIHDGEAPARQIHGVATLSEARALLSDGIPVVPLPTLPDELN